MTDLLRIIKSNILLTISALCLLILLTGTYFGENTYFYELILAAFIFIILSLIFFELNIKVPGIIIDISLIILSIFLFTTSLIFSYLGGSVAFYEIILLIGSLLSFYGSIQNLFRRIFYKNKGK